MNSSTLQVTNHPFPASRLGWRLNQPLEHSLRRLHAVLRVPSVARLLLYSKLGAKSRLENYLKQVAGEWGLMNLRTVRHGLLMSTLNGARHAQMFLIGK